MLLECVGCVGYRADTALRIVGVTLIKFTLGNESYGCCVGHLEGKAQSCRSGTDNQKITLHFFVMFYSYCKFSKKWGVIQSVWQKISIFVYENLDNL